MGTRFRDSDLKNMLNKLGYAPAQALLNQAIKQSVDSIPDVLSILGILRFIRESEVTNLRRNAGLPDHIAEKVRSKFSLKIQQGKRIEPAEFERFMYELYKAARHSQTERAKVKAIIQDHCKGARFDLMEGLWIVRQYGDAREEDA